MKKLLFLAALFIAAAFLSCSKHDGVETPDWPDPQPLAVAFAEGNSLEFDVDETKTVHYTITGGSSNTVVKAEMQTADDAYTVETTPASATEGTIAITAKMPETENCVLVTVSDGSQTVTAEIAVSTKPSSQKLAITFAEGNSLEFDVNEAKIVHYTITGGSDIPVVKAEMKNPDDAYTVEITPISTTEEAIIITAKTPTDNCVIVTVSDGSQTVTAEIAVSPRSSSQELAIAFAEGNSLQLNLNEPKTINYTITGGSDKTVVTAEMQTPDDAYMVETTPTSATEGTIAITVQKPTYNWVIVTVSDDNRSITAAIAITVTLKAFDGKTIEVETPGTLSQLLADYDETTITELTVIGNLNDEDIATLNNLPNLAVLDMEQVNLEVLPANAFSLNKKLTSVKLPLTLKTIGDSAFSNCFHLTSITIPDGITAIGSNTFFNCNLTSIMIPDGVTSIGDYAFCFCSRLTSITIPDGVTTIGGFAFSGCSGLTSITIPDSVTSIGGWAFDSCRSLTSVTIGSSVTVLGYSAFSGCSSLTSITIPDSVTTIGDLAFSGCSGLTSITIPDSVTTIGERAFYGCSSLRAFYGRFASSDNRCLIVDSQLIAFIPVGLTAYTIPDGVTSIWHYAFCDCSSLTSITIPDGVRGIGASAFSGCNSLTSITIPDSVTTIWESAFSGCSSLTSVTIGSSVRWIEYDAFMYCSSLTSVYCKAIAPPSITADVFYNYNATLYVPTGSKAAYAAATEWEKFTRIEETQF